MSAGWATVRSAPAKAFVDRLLWSVLVPGCGALLIVRYLVPSPMEGRSGSIVALVGRLADEYLLAVGVGLFIALSAAVGYWRGRLGAGIRPAAVARLDRRSVARLASGLGLAILAALFVRSSLLETYWVVSGSMTPTLLVGDRLLVNKVAYGFRLPFTKHTLGARLPRRGDVVVFRANGALAWEKLPTDSLVKRVIGLPGDRVSFEGDRVVVNGWRVPICDAGPYAAPTEKQTVRGRLVVEYLEDQTYLGLRPVGAPPFQTFTVPPGQVFVIGDDRVDSNDSRSWNGGRGAGVPISAIDGRVTRILAGSRGEDGRLHLSRLLAPLGPDVRRPGVDLARTQQWVGQCLKTRPALTTPPAPHTRSR